MRVPQKVRTQQPPKLTPCACGCGRMGLQRYATRACVPHHAHRGTQKALPSQHISLGRSRAQRQAVAPTESWWQGYAAGDRRDEAYMAEAERRPNATTDRTT